MGPFKTNLIRFRLVNSLVQTKGMKRSKAREHVADVIDDAIAEIVNYVAAKHGKLEIIAAEFGDGVILDKLLAFLNEHWDEILALFLKLIGMV